MKFVSLLLAPLFVLACSSNDKPTGNMNPDMATAAPPPPAMLMACSDVLADVYSMPSPLPTFDAGHRGDVVRCGYDRYLSASESKEYGLVDDILLKPPVTAEDDEK